VPTPKRVRVRPFSRIFYGFSPDDPPQLLFIYLQCRLSVQVDCKLIFMGSSLEPRRVHENELLALVYSVSKAMATDSKAVVELSPLPRSDIHSRPRRERIHCEFPKGGGTALRILGRVPLELHEIPRCFGVEPNFIAQASQGSLRGGRTHPLSSP